MSVCVDALAQRGKIIQPMAYTTAKIGAADGYIRFNWID